MQIKFLQCLYNDLTFRFILNKIFRYNFQLNEFFFARKEKIQIFLSLTRKVLLPLEIFDIFKIIYRMATFVS